MEKMTLKSYYESLPEPTAPKTEFVRKIAKLCEVGEPTVRLWIRGLWKPSNPEHIAIISKETGITADDLFNETNLVPYRSCNRRSNV